MSSQIETINKTIDDANKSKLKLKKEIEEIEKRITELNIQKLGLMKRDNIPKVGRETVELLEKRYDMSTNTRRKPQRPTKEHKEAIHTKRIELCDEKGIEDAEEFVKQILKPRLP